MNADTVPLEWKRAVAAATVALAAGVLTVATAAAETLTVYTAIAAADRMKYADRFNQDHPEVEITWVGGSTGIITAKLLGEKDNPRADIVWQLAATSLMLLDAEGMLEPYAPRGSDQILRHFRDPKLPSAWTGTDAWIAVVCYNTVEAAKYNLPRPRSWRALLDPVYKRHLAMPDPASSGTGFLDVSSWIQMFGERAGWEYMDALHENVWVYTHSGSQPAKMAATGEITIGISYADKCARLKSKGAPVDLIFPNEGIGWEMEAVAILKGTKKLEAAKKLADWAISRKAMAMYNETYPVVAIPGVAKPRENYPADVADLMIRNDFVWAATNRARILKEWQRRYAVKSGSSD